MANYDCSFIFPLLNEHDNIMFSYEKIHGIMKDTKYTFEIIYVDDGSTDDSVEIIKKLAAKDKDVKLVSFSRNFGQHPAIMAGFGAATGKCAINMDIDMQEDPSVIPEMLKKWEEGFEIVTIKRKKRKESITKRLMDKMYYGVLSHLGQKNISNLADFRLLDQKVISAITSLQDNNIYIRSQLDSLGFKSTTLLADRNERQNGKTKYNLKKMAKTAIKSIVSSTVKPLYYAFTASFISFMFAFMSLVTFVVLACVSVPFSPSFWLIPIILGCTGIITLCLGFIGIYLGFTYDQARQKPAFIIRETVNIDKE